MIAVIVKGFAGHKPGELVDTEGWRNETNLLRARHIRGASSSESEAFRKGSRTVHDMKPGKASKA